MAFKNLQQETKKGTLKEECKLLDDDSWQLTY